MTRLLCRVLGCNAGRITWHSSGHITILCTRCWTGRDHHRR